MAIEIKVPTVGESVNEVTLSRWIVEEGQYVEMDESLCELESDKASFEVPAEKSGTVHIVASEGDDLNIGDLLCTIDPEGKPAEGQKEKKEKKEEPKEEVVEKETPEERQEEESAKTYAHGHPSPAAAKLIEEKQLDPEKINGSGKDGRITKEDVLKAIENGEANTEEKTEKTSTTVQRKSREKFSRQTREVPMSRLRRTIADRLVAAKNQTAMLTTFNEVNMQPVMEIRKQYKEIFQKKHGANLGFMSFFTKAVCHALLEFPEVNAQIEENKLKYHDYCDISIAVSTPRGLIVPVIRNAESLSMAEIEDTVIDLATRGRDNQLSLEEMSGGTFTITNGGVFGSLMSTPIINVPQAAILGMHKIQERPMVENGQVVVRPMMYLALSYDHRIIDGKESVSFLVRVKEYLENPASLLVGGDPVKQLLDL